MICGNPGDLVLCTCFLYTFALAGVSGPSSNIIIKATYTLTPCSYYTYSEVLKTLELSLKKA